jgi:hypothetical protein
VSFFYLEFNADSNHINFLEKHLEMKNGLTAIHPLKQLTKMVCACRSMLCEMKNEVIVTGLASYCSMV